MASVQSTDYKENTNDLWAVKEEVKKNIFCRLGSADETAGLCHMLKCKSGTKRAAGCDGCPGHAHVLTGISSVTVQE